MKEFIKLINEKIEDLRDEITSIGLTSSECNLKTTEHDENIILELKSKIQVLKELKIKIQRQ